MRCLWFAIPLLLCLLSCEDSQADAVQIIDLDREMFDNSVQRRFFHRGIGWDSIPDSLSLMYYPDIGLVEVRIKGKDVALRTGDSVRIGIVHPIRQFRADTSHAAPFLPDLLLLSIIGQDSLPLSFMTNNVGLIRQQTYFRVGRHHYHLSSVDSSRSQISIKPLPLNSKRTTVAAIDLRFKPVRVKTLEQEHYTINRASGKALLLFFWSMGAKKGKDLQQLDSLYQLLPEGAPLEVMAINRGDRAENILHFREETQLRIPIYASSASTCDGLDCSAVLPQMILVNEEGRIVGRDLISVLKLLQKYIPEGR